MGLRCQCHLSHSGARRFVCTGLLGEGTPQTASKRWWPLLESREEAGAQEGSAQPGGRGRAQLVVWMWRVIVEGLGLHILWAMGSHGRLWNRRLRVLGSMFVCGTGDGESSGRESFHPGEKGCEAQRPSCRKENVGTGRWRRKRVAGGWVGRGQGSYLRSGMVSPGACIRHTRSQ